MSTNLSLEKCVAFLNSQMLPLHSGSDRSNRLAVTFSRQAGCGAHMIAEKLAERLRDRGAGKAGSWTVFDRNLVEKVLEDHSLPKRLARFMPEDRVPEIQDTMDELFGLHPPSWLLIRNTAETILHLAELGNVILIGRGANIITSRLKYVFHVRLVAPLEKRLENVKRYDHLGEKEALDSIQTQDQGRRRYLKKYFHKDIDDPLLYHMVINTGLLSHDEAVGVICETLLSRQTRPALAAA